MNFTRKVVVTILAAAVTTGVVGMASPASARVDSSWGCGGYCLVAK